MLVLFYRHIDDGVSDDFTKISDHFPKISKDFLKLFRRPDERSRTFSENYRRLPKTFEEDPKMLPSYTNKLKYILRDKLDISEIIDIFTSEDMENTPLDSRMQFRIKFTSGFSSKALVYI